MPSALVLKHNPVFTLYLCLNDFPILVNRVENDIKHHILFQLNEVSRLTLIKKHILLTI
jgi:hypothetical protein